VISRNIANRDVNCEECGMQVFCGEVIYLCDETLTIACSHECCDNKRLGDIDLSERLEYLDAFEGA
jgi:hypothetical protein